MLVLVPLVLVPRASALSCCQLWMQAQPGLKLLKQFSALAVVLVQLVSALTLMLKMVMVPLASALTLMLGSKMS